MGDFPYELGRKFYKHMLIRKEPTKELIYLSICSSYKEAIPNTFKKFCIEFNNDLQLETHPDVPPSCNSIFMLKFDTHLESLKFKLITWNTTSLFNSLAYTSITTLIIFYSLLFSETTLNVDNTAYYKILIQ